MKALVILFTEILVFFCISINAEAQHYKAVRVQNEKEAVRSVAASQRMNASCYHFASREAENPSQCVYTVSFIELIAHPDRYNHKLVAVTGYLVSDFGDLILYPNKTSYMGNKSTERIPLERPFSINKKLIKLTKHGVYPVLVVAYFDSHALPVGTSVPRLGTFFDIKKITLTPRIPSGSELDMRGITITK